MKSIKSIFLMIMGLTITQVLFSQFVTDHGAIFQGDLIQPQQGVQITDPNFNTPLLRLTNARTLGLPGQAPDYSKRQAWNSDESLLLLRSGWSDAYLYDGNNYQFIKALDGVAGDDVLWNPADPHKLYYANDSALYSYDVITDQKSVIHLFEPYNFATTGAEGNLSNDGQYIALVEYFYDYSSGAVSYHDFIVYDMFNDQIISTFVFAGQSFEDFDWISISPLGNYVVVDYANWENGRYRGIEVYDRNFNFIWQKGLGPGHSDLGLDANGEEVLIIDVYNENDNLTHICKFKLANGDSTELLTLNSYLDLHESCRSILRPGWVYVSTFDFAGRLSDSSTDWFPFEDEVFALKMDGSGSVQRYAHHRSKEYSTLFPNRDSGAIYFSEPRATVSKSGTRIVFASNWRTVMNEEASVDAYLVDLRNMITGIPDQESNEGKLSFRIFPNPVVDKLTLISEKGMFDGKVFLFDLVGSLIKECVVNQANTSMNLTDLPAGIYYYKIVDKESLKLEVGKIVKF